MSVVLLVGGAARADTGDFEPPKASADLAKDIGDRTPPKRLSDLFQEARQVDEELSRYTKYVDQESPLPPALTTLIDTQATPIDDALTKLEAATKDCSIVEASASTDLALRQLSDAVRDLDPQIDVLQKVERTLVESASYTSKPWTELLASWRLQTIPPISWKASKTAASWSMCQAFANVGSKRSTAAAYITSIKARAAAAGTVIATRKKIDSDIKVAYKAYKVKIQKDIDDQSQTLAEKVPLLIVIIGVFSLAIMVMVRRFSKKVQNQWVTSGQVIQFMTVTVLVIAILALGLAQKLSENVLGTLIAGIAGHVLSQGVGRAAADAAKRAVEDQLKDKKPPADGPGGPGGPGGQGGPGGPGVEIPSPAPTAASVQEQTDAHDTVAGAVTEAIKSSRPTGINQTPPPAKPTTTPPT